NCQKACKKCDEGRPCQRCIKYGLTDTCIDSTRKERKKGIKRGPYKRRQQSGSANGNTTPTLNQMNTPNGSQYSSMNGSPNMRTPMPFTYPPNINQFGGQTYELNNAYSTYNYQKEQQLMPNQYMVPPMFSTSGPMLSYPLVVSAQPDMIPRTMSASPPQQYSPHQRQLRTPVPSTSTSSVGSPESDQEEDGSKLNILSQLCSAVLDHSDPKNGSDDQDYDSLSGHESDEQDIKRRHSGMSSHTPPPSPGHSRHSSYDSDSMHRMVHDGPQMFHAPSFGHDSPHTYINGHITHRSQMMYGTPNSSPSASPTDSTFGMPASPKAAVAPPPHFWPLPPLQSVVPPEHLYNHHYANVGHGMQAQHTQEGWGMSMTNPVTGW
ncbi:hypothetical protein BC938DRAFT_478309, partial [Jimgerdemannia flammicorona]